MALNPTDKELFALVLQVEDQLEQEGLDPKGRHFKVPSVVMKKLGYESYFMFGPGSPEVLDRIRGIQSKLYRPSDVGVGGLHGGAFMFRGISTWIYVPMAFGTVSLNPFQLCDLNVMQQNWLASRESDLDAFLRTFADLWDFAGGYAALGGYESPPKESMPLLGLAAFHIQSAAAALCRAFDTRGSVQSSIIASELVLKAALKGSGVPDSHLKKLGHNLPRLAEEVAQHWTSVSLNRLSSAIGKLPPYVENRYSEAQPTRSEAGEIVMAAQHIAGEVVRGLTGGDAFAKLKTGG